MNKRQQILIVLWKWENFGGGVNAKLFRERRFEKHVAQIERGQGVYYQEFPVEYSELCPDAKFVQASIYKDDTNTERLFFALLEHYISPESEVLLFLHRAHFYTDEDVVAIRARFGKNNLKCFLFADGRDYIYYATQKSGLLNDAGGFFIQRDKDTDEYIETFDEARRVVRQPYFDRVWSHYRDEFQQKIFTLKEELFNCWFELLLPGQPAQIAVEEVKDRLNRQPERLLLFRVKSFLGYYTGVDLSGMERFELKKEERAVEELERKEGKSYLFDDAIANLAIEKERDRPLIVETYGEAKQMLEQVLFGLDINTSQSALRDLADKFNLLVHVFPGELSN